MGILKRIGRLISADVHGIIDFLEEPADTCKQAIREMEEELVLLKESQKERELRFTKTGEQRKRSIARRVEVEQQLALCLKQADDSLSRNIIKKRLEQEKLIRFLDKQLESTSAEISRAAKQIAEYEERLASIKEKLSCFSERAAAQNPLSEEWSETLSVSEDEVELALLQAKSGSAA